MRIFLNIFVCVALLGFFIDPATAKSKRKNSSRPQFEVLSEHNILGSFGVRINSLTDGLIIQDVVINDGRCEVVDRVAESHFGRELDYGESIFLLTNCSSKIHVFKTQIITNTGSWSYQLKRPEYTY